MSHQLSWSHIVELLPLKEQNQRVFYAYMSIQENWSVSKLRSNIDKMLYERTKLSQKPNNEQVLSLLKMNSQLYNVLKKLDKKMECCVSEIS